MKLMLLKSVITCMACICAGLAFATEPADSIKQDWAQHNRYAAANSTITRAPDVVFIGNSITDGWYTFRPEFFTAHNFAGRGIAGQVTAQMLCRFKADVIDLHPRVVVICGGVNDLVGNNGNIDIPYIVDNIASMVDLARAYGIIPIVGTALPSNYAFWKPEFEGLAELIKTYNAALTRMCAERDVTVVDYYTPMATPDGGIIDEYSLDRLHPNARGYEVVMEPLVLEAINKVLSPVAPKPITVPLWPDDAPNDNGLTPADEKIDGVMEANIASPVLYIYPAEHPNGVGIVCCPGGAYYGVAMDHEGHDMARWMNSMGITFAVLRYRMPNGGHYDVPLSDAEQAMKIMHEHAAEWSLDTNKIGVMGFSAGGHLASTLATHYSSPDTRPGFQVLIYPVISMDAAITHSGSRENILGKQPSASLIKNFSNELHVNSQTPPAFFAVSADDSLVPVANTLRYVQALADANVATSLQIYPTGGHGWGFNDEFPYKAAWTAQLASWLKTL